MKKIVILIFMLFVLISTGNSQYYDDGYEYDDNYYESDYDDYYYNDYDDNYLSYYYGYDDALPYISAHVGPVYYWLHPYRDVYFVLIGRRIFVMPGYRLRPMLYRLGWLGVAMDRFITLSCCGLHYYDNYVRFNYYYDYYRGHHYNRYNNYWVRSHYRDYYRSRRKNRRYFGNWNRVMKTKRIIRKNTLSRDRYDRNKNRSRNYTTNNRKPVISNRSYSKYNTAKSNKYNRIDSYKDSSRKRTVIRKKSMPNSSSSYDRRLSKVTGTNYSRKPTTSYNRRISKTSGTSYSRKPSSTYRQKVSKVSYSKYRKPSKSSRSSYSNKKVSKVRKSSSGKSSSSSRKVIKKRRH